MITLFCSYQPYRTDQPTDKQIIALLPLQKKLRSAFYVNRLAMTLGKIEIFSPIIYIVTW